METLNNLHALEVSFIAPTNTRGGRVKIKSNRFRQSIITDFKDDAYTYEAGQRWLLDNGFELVAQAEGKDSYIILSTTFKPLK